MSTAPKSGGCGRRILTAVIVLIIACVVLGGIAYVVAGPAIGKLINAFAAPISANNDFMTALIAKDYTKAYSLIHPSQQASFGASSDGMKQMFVTNGWEPSTYTFANIQLATDTKTGNSVDLINGTGTFNGTLRYVYVQMQPDGDTWKISYFTVNDTAPTATPAGQ